MPMETRIANIVTNKIPIAQACTPVPNPHA